ncbi:hypothetical protein JTB14_025795 [Gonioctena quinquepunctata]|nr:hypothetical protein JTB14_025795 [Gonioctena quinquepunctata]
MSRGKKNSEDIHSDLESIVNKGSHVLQWILMVYFVLASPRVILVNFVSGVKRNDVIEARRALKDTGSSVYENPTKHRYNILSAAKKKLGNNQAWSSNGKVYIWCAHENKRRIVASVGDL